MVEVAKGRLQLDAKIHDDEMQMEAQIVADASHLASPPKIPATARPRTQRRSGLPRKIDSENARFNAEAAMKMRQGSGI